MLTSSTGGPSACNGIVGVLEELQFFQLLVPLLGRRQELVNLPHQLVRRLPTVRRERCCAGQPSSLGPAIPVASVQWKQRPSPRMQHAEQVRGHTGKTPHCLRGSHPVARETCASALPGACQRSRGAATQAVFACAHQW